MPGTEYLQLRLRPYWACEGYYSGNATLTFQVAPAANVICGQIAKIAANAAGYADPVPSTRQTFEDVPLRSPFWLFVEQVVEWAGELGVTPSSLLKVLKDNGIKEKDYRGWDAVNLASLF